MKKGVLFTVVLILIGVSFYLSRSKLINEVVITDLGVTSQSLSPTPPALIIASSKSGDIEFSNSTYRYALWTAQSPQGLKLVENYSDMKHSNRLMEEFSCTYGINGGLYDENHKPLGLVVVNNKTVAKVRNSQTFNGVVGVVSDKEFYVGDNFDQPFSYAVQTGPLLMKNGSLLDLRLVRDKKARRMVAIKDTAGKLHMVAIYSGDSKIDGPLLDELPQVIEGVSKENGFVPEWAINLDGGSASALRGGQVQIEEWQPVGSWWCYV